MSNFDLIDDYLTNRLSESERSVFERSMNADPALKSEVERQSVLVEGIKKARAAQLKAMLNQVPVGSASLWSDWSVMKMAATIGVAGVIGTGLYFYLKNNQTVIQNVPKAEVPVDSLLPDSSNEIMLEEKKEEETDNSQSTKSAVRLAKPKKDQSATPKVSVTDPSSEMLTDGNSGESASISEKSIISVSTINVERDSQNKLYSFHYQFKEDKLFLYGPFDEALYEILEVHGTNHALFLFFKDNFYHLDERKAEATELTPIRDRSLIQKLKEFRSAK